MEINNKKTEISLEECSKGPQSSPDAARIRRSNSVGSIPDNDLEKNNANILKQRVSKPMKCRDFLRDYVAEYTSNSSLHGLKYIGDKDRTCAEKVFWVLLFVCSAMICALLIRNVWSKWNESPVIVSLAENTTPVWQIPYPAVTVCFETKAMQTKFNFTEYYHLYYNNDTYANLTDEESDKFEDVSMICDDHLAPPQGRKFSSGLDIISTIQEVSPNMEDSFFGCKWKDSPSQDCSDLFSPIITEEGICYTFNTLSAEDLFRIDNLHTDYSYLEHGNEARSWTLENGYGKSEPFETYPHRGSGFGVKSGLTFLLKANGADLDYLCRGPVQGFKILLHNPAELPRISQQYFRSPLSQEVVVAVKPTLTTTSEGLLPYDPIRRQCFFSSERYLHYFKVYTQANCEMECLSNFTYTRCGCVHFGMPRGPDMHVCNSGSMECIKKSQRELVTIEIQSGLGQSSDDDDDNLRKAREVASKCQCLPSCTSIKYEAETSQADYDWRAIYRAYRLNATQEDDLYFSRVMIFFKEAQFISSQRSVLYGPTDFLANCGGLLALFMGFSILSVAEIVYFLTLRLFYKFWRRNSPMKNL